MSGISNVISKINPISIKEFSESIHKVWNLPKSHGQTPLRLGLAVSGGADSMALAHLVKQLAHDTTLQPPTVRIEPFAFIVDHGIRPNSTEEARQVSSWLTEKREKFSHYKEMKLIRRPTVKIPNEVLTIQIPKPSQGSHSKVEQLARTYRFRAMGTACYRHRIDRLLLAHHWNDEVETTVLRLYLGSKNLRGIAPAGEIPECEGIYGVHQSGGKDVQDLPAKYKGLFNCKTTPITDWQSEPVGWRRTRIHTESGGVQIVRPLLDFPKERLVVTCNHHKIPWVEDKTNLDAHYTVRNTIRYLFKYKQLPNALREASLSKRIKCISCRLDHLDQRALQILEESRTLLDPRNGVLSIQVRNFIPVDIEGDKLSIRDYRIIAALLVRRLVATVTPRAQISISRMHGAVAEMFPQLYPSHTGHKSFSSSFHVTLGEVSLSKANTKNIPSGWDHSSPTYRFMRQKPQSRWANVSAIVVTDLIGTEADSWSDWQLFDGRFWIRVINPKKDTLVLRPFQLKDMLHVLSWSNGAKEGDAKMRKLLQHATPTGMRHVIPALAKVTKEDDKYSACFSVSTDPMDTTTGNSLPLVSKFKGPSSPRVQGNHDLGFIVALPTLCCLDPKEISHGLRTEVRYRKLLSPVRVLDTTQ